MRDHIELIISSIAGLILGYVIFELVKELLCLP